MQLTIMSRIFDEYECNTLTLQKAIDMFDYTINLDYNSMLRVKLMYEVVNFIFNALTH